MDLILIRMQLRESLVNRGATIYQTKRKAGWPSINCLINGFSWKYFVKLCYWIECTL